VDRRHRPADDLEGFMDHLAMERHYFARIVHELTADAFAR